jgi:transcriptional regulator of acetoin/glycerol metabolism
MEALEAYAWPGNVRELENRLQRACLVARGGVIGPDDLDFRELAPTPSAERSAFDALSEDEAGERAQLLAVLDRAEGVVSRAARELGLTRQALYRRMQRLRISLERRRAVPG